MMWPAGPAEREDRGGASECSLYRFSVVNGTVEAEIGVRGAGLKSPYLPFRSVFRPSCE
jgi:hypothetical protein